MRCLGIGAVCSLALAPPALAADSMGNVLGQIDLANRYYSDDGQYEGQSKRGFYPFVGSALNRRFGVGAGEAMFQFSWLNNDENDPFLIDIQKAYFTNGFETLDLELGYNVKDWGVSNGPAIFNVLNAKNRTNKVGNSDLSECQCVYPCGYS